MVRLQRRGDLLEFAVVEDGDSVAHRHRLRLVVSDVDGGDAEVLLQALELRPHLRAKFGVQVGQRLVHQEHLGVAHDGAPEGDPLLLAAGEFAGLAVEQVGDAEHGRRLLDEFVDVGVAHVSRLLQPEAHVPADGHVRVQRVRLEHHRDVPVARRAVVHPVVAESNLALGDGFQPRNHAERGRFPAPRGTDEDEELAVLDGHGGVVDGDDFGAAVVEELRYVVEREVSHGSVCVSWWSSAMRRGRCDGSGGSRPRRVRVGSCAARDPLRELVPEQDVDEQRRQGGDERAGHLRVERLDDAAGQFVERDGRHRRGAGPRGDDDEREQQVVPDLRELVDERHREHRHRKREHDAAVDGERARAVEASGLQHLRRELLVVASEQQRRDGNPVRRVGDDEVDDARVVRVGGEFDRPEDGHLRREHRDVEKRREQLLCVHDGPEPRQRDEHRLVRDEDTRDEQRDDAELAAPLEVREAVRREAAEQRRQHRRRHGQHDAVEDSRRQRVDGDAERFEREALDRRRHERRRRGELGFGLQRGHQPRFEGRQVEHHQSDERRVEGDAQRVDGFEVDADSLCEVVADAHSSPRRYSP
ncbi:phenol hydroxylase [Haloferax prahovense DSM 18310]|uniref:Phenol hydroxylase n=1 Tax=Haloferax prahovense (strain DSM 18310 / JCM 13924 / TL6) TaxID=1227461 RepID=M0G9N0_HALPT|nr:phenol hydroxylase [Haloferax prahovense DSM 18310]